MTGRHRFIPLEAGNKNYYASCNILNDEGLVYVYLLHPIRGSILFTLIFDEAQSKYEPRYIVPGLDVKTVDLINEKLSETDEGLPDIFNDRFKLIETDSKYEYFVINRIFTRTQNILKTTERFHIFHEQWESFNEYEIDKESGVNVKSGQPPDLKQVEIMYNAINEM